MIDEIASFLSVENTVNVGIGGFTADVQLNTSIAFSSEAPDSYVEDGTIIHDHIINNPVTITIDGQVSDIQVKPSFSDGTPLGDIIDKANTIIDTLYSARKTQQTLERVAKQTKEISSISDVIGVGEQLYNIFSGAEQKTPQDDFFTFIDKVYTTKELISIETPFKNYDNMRITSLIITRDNTTKQALRYKLSAKEIRFAETITVEKDKYFKAPTPSTKGKVKSKKNKGVVEGQKNNPQSSSSSQKNEDKSFLYTILK